MKTLTILLIVLSLFSCSKEETTEESINVPQSILNDLKDAYGIYEDLNSSKTIQVVYPDKFIYNGISYIIETQSIYVYNILNCDYVMMSHLRDDVWVLQYWNGEYYDLEVFKKK